jgi:hypothetical protein
MSKPDFRQNPGLVAAGVVATILVFVVLTILAKAALSAVTSDFAPGPRPQHRR